MFTFQPKEFIFSKAVFLNVALFQDLARMSSTNVVFTSYFCGRDVLKVVFHFIYFSGENCIYNFC